MTSPLLVRSRMADAREVVSIQPGRADWNYIDFRVLRLRDSEDYAAQTGADELAIVVIEGSIAVQSSAGNFQRVGKRADPFEGPPEGAYLPPGTAYTIRARGNAEIALCAAAGRQQARPARLLTCEAQGRIRGSGHAQRRIFDLLMGEDDASTLFVTEVLTFAGNWSSYPPHKHDRDDPPNESQLEELYYYRLKPQAGFAFQRIYSADGALDETITAHDRDVVLVPRGYHVCAAAPEYTLYYLNVLAGPKHVYRMTFDPEHAWIKEGWNW